MTLNESQKRRVAEIALSVMTVIDTRYTEALCLQRDVERAILAALQDPTLNGREWLPIESAPKDLVILLYRPTAAIWAQVSVGKFDDDKFAKKPKPFWEIWLKIGRILESRNWEPTHWMPLPAAPAKEEL